MARQWVYQQDLIDRIEDLAVQGLGSARIRNILAAEFGESSTPSTKALERHMRSLKVQTYSQVMAQARR
jgi:hypothetical protein